VTTRARFPLCLLLALVALFPLGGCGRYSSGSPPPPAASRTVPATTAPERTPASDGELARYAEREKQSAGLEKFEGGRMSDATLIIVILLIVIIIVLIV
jgi:hypothetical protein